VKLLIIFFLLIIYIPLNAEDISSTPLPIDSSRVEERKPSESSIAKFKEDKDFIYDESKSLNWWDAFWLWLGNLLSKFLGSKTFGFFQKYLGYVIILAAIIIVILVLNKSKLSGLFYYSRENKISGFKEMKENINKIDFDALISEAVSKTDYRIAVRLYYLKTLKLLADRKLIDWNINKTNHNYIKEIKEAKLKNTFEELTNLFEWIWYGELPVEAYMFKKTKNIFMDFQDSLIVEK
jgi:Domain of unknown function (DUF4129)